ncbi:hypothetical protein QOT17_025411 [Balamuthia mandrillaris]
METFHHTDEAPVPELLLLHGPPSSGKTAYCRRELSNHFRVVPKELFETQQDLSLHRIIQLVLGKLQQGQNVVVDDCNTAASTRGSYIKAVSQKLPDCRIKCLVIRPPEQHGLLLCKWLNEWSIAGRNCTAEKESHTLHSSPSEPASNEWEEWSSVPDPPLFSEGFHDIQYLTLSLQPQEVAGLSLTNEALIIDGRVMFHYVTDDDFLGLDDGNGGNGKRPATDLTPTLREGVVQSLQDYHAAFPSHRLIVIIDEGELYPLGLETGHLDALDKASTILRYRLALSQALLSICLPLYYLRINYGSPLRENNFFMSGQGMLAFLQYRHCLRLSSCLFVCENIFSSSSASVTTATCSGFTTTMCELLRHCPQQSFFARDGWTIHSKMRKYVKDTTVASHPAMELLERLESSGSTHRASTTAHFPLQPQLSSDGTAEETFANERIHGLCWGQQPPLLPALSVEPELSPTSATVATSASSSMLSPSPRKPLIRPSALSPSPRRLPEWMSPGSRTRAKSPTTQAQPRTPTTGTPNPPLRRQLFIPKKENESSADRRTTSHEGKATQPIKIEIVDEEGESAGNIAANCSAYNNNSQPEEEEACSPLTEDLLVGLGNEDTDDEDGNSVGEGDRLEAKHKEEQWELNKGHVTFSSNSHKRKADARSPPQASSSERSSTGKRTFPALTVQRNEQSTAPFSFKSSTSSTSTSSPSTSELPTPSKKPRVSLRQLMNLQGLMPSSTKSDP